MRTISKEKIERIKKQGVFYYITTQYPGWFNTIKVNFCSWDEEKFHKQVGEYGYNIFLSKDEADKCLQEITKIYEKYKDK